MPFIPRTEALQRLHAQITAKKPIIGAGAGTGISAKFAERGGVDLIIIYNSGRYRMAGRGSLAGLMPYGDANAIVVDMAREVLPIVQNTPVLAGVCGTDPFRLMRVFLPQLRDMGFDGVQNFPTVGLIDGQFRQMLEETGMGIQHEIEMIALAHELDMLTCPYVFDVETTREFTKAGADVVVAHVNTTIAGSIGVTKAAISLDEAVERVRVMHDTAKKINKDVIVLCHGGPIARPQDAQHVLSRIPGVAGFFGASSIERLATEPAIEEQTRKFKSIRLG
jgi:predicted TIM-barrel enzyme